MVPQEDSKTGRGDKIDTLIAAAIMASDIFAEQARYRLGQGAQGRRHDYPYRCSLLGTLVHLLPFAPNDP